MTRLLRWLTLLAAVSVASAASPDAGALQRLRDGQDWFDRGRQAEAWREFSLAADQADSSYLSIEALTRLANMSPAGSRERASATGRLMALFAATPPRWLSEPARVLAQQTIADRVSSGAYPEQQAAAAPAALDFAGTETGLGFQGKRYSWIAPIAEVPPPVDDFLVDGSPVQLNDPDCLPEPRLRMSGETWALTDPRHAGKSITAAERRGWEFDRVLAGYTFEAILDQPTMLDPTRTIATPMERWYPNQSAIWQLRFRVFYPSRALSGADYYPLAQQLLQTLLTAQQLGVEVLGRESHDNYGRDQILDVWLTSQTAAALADGGGETYLNNLYFYAIDRGRPSLEWVREALHEYSHAMMPKIGRYTAAESHEVWLEGYLGERLLMQALHNLLQKRSAADLDEWLRSLKSGPQWEPYDQQYLRAPVDYWLKLGPVAAERGAADDRGAAWLLGFQQWLVAAHEPRFVYDYFAPMAPNAQYTWQSLERAYQARIDEQPAYRLRAAAPARQITGAAPQRVDGVVKLQADVGLEYSVWLSAGLWSLRLLSEGPGAATVTIGDGVEKLTETGPDAKSAPANRIHAESGWYRIQVKGFGPQELALRELLLAKGK